MPLIASQIEVRRHIKCFYDPVIGCRHNVQSVSYSLHRLMMKAVGGNPIALHNGIKRGIANKLNLMGEYISGLGLQMLDMIIDLTRYVLIEGAAQCDVYKLSAPAYSYNGLFGTHSYVKRHKFDCIAVSIDPSAGRGKLLRIANGIYITSSTE